MTLLELAERCEAAPDADEALSNEIWYAVGRPNEYLVRDLKLDPPDYTASLDAAMTLVPKDYDWIIGRTNGGLTIHAEVGGRGDEFQRFGNTPALALCAAALRTRSTQEGDKG